MIIGIVSAKAICTGLYLIILCLILHNHRLGFCKHLLLYCKPSAVQESRAMDCYLMCPLPPENALEYNGVACRLQSCRDRY